jgi:hypothetical protein
MSRRKLLQILAPFSQLSADFRSRSISSLSSASTSTDPSTGKRQLQPPLHSCFGERAGKAIRPSLLRLVNRCKRRVYLSLRKGHTNKEPQNTSSIQEVPRRSSRWA